MAVPTLWEHGASYLTLWTLMWPNGSWIRQLAPSKMTRNSTMLFLPSRQKWNRDALLGRMKVEENVLDAGTLVCV